MQTIDISFYVCRKTFFHVSYNDTYGFDMNTHCLVGDSIVFLHNDELFGPASDFYRNWRRYIGCEFTDDNFKDIEEDLKILKRDYYFCRKPTYTKYKKMEEKICSKHARA